MPLPIFIAYDPADHRIADTVRRDLVRRGWRPEVVALGSRHPLKSGLPLVALLSGKQRMQRTALRAVKKMAAEASRTIVVIDPKLSAPKWMYEATVDAVIPLGDGRDYDTFFDDLSRALQPDMPSWLDVRVRPTLIQRPTGVAWWTNDLVVADERYEHLVRIGVEGASVLVPGLCEPIHVTIDRRDVVVANKGADELLCVTVEDGMSTKFGAIREIGATGTPLAKPHFGSSSNAVSVVCNTDRHEVFVRDRRITSPSDEGWRMLQPPKPFEHPCGAHASSSLIWVADTFNHRVVAFGRDGAFARAFGKYGRHDVAFQFPVAVCSWGDYLFVSDEEGKRLQVFLTSATDDQGLTMRLAISDFAGSWIRSPFGLSVNREGVLAVSDRDASCIWLIELSEALGVLS